MTNVQWRSWLVLSGIVVLLSEAGTAAQMKASTRLRDASRLMCSFAVAATGTWNADAPDASVQPAKLSIEFGSIDADGATAQALGSFGASDIVVRLSGETLHFMQVFRDGPVYLTTVFPEVMRDGRLLAVHSRHEFTRVVLPGFTSRPEQYYGACEILAAN